MKYGDAKHKTLIGMAGGFGMKGCRVCAKHNYNYVIGGGHPTKMNSNNLRHHLQSVHSVLLAKSRRWWQFWK